MMIQRVSALFVMRRWLFFLLFLFASHLSYSQKKLEILHAGSLKFDESLGNGAKRLIGDVQFKHEDALMFCDSAYFYSDNSLDAFGHIHINQNDSIHLYGDLLKYSGNTKQAVVSNNVIVTKNDMQLTTDILNYDIGTSVGYYTTSARIVNKENELISKQGYFFGKSNELKFKKDVVLTNQKKGKKEPDFVIKCDTMNYNTSTKITTFIGPTTIKSENNLIYCEDGFYDTEKDLSRFSKNSYILTEEQKMLGDSLYYDGSNEIGRAVNNVQIIDTAQHTTITGDYAIHYQLLDLSIVTGKALLTRINEKDTLYLHADTLKSIGSVDSDSQNIKKQTPKAKVAEPKKGKQLVKGKKNKKEEGRSEKIDDGKQKAEDRKQKNNGIDSLAIAKDTASIKTNKETEKRKQYLYAYHRVKFYKSDLQGKCDSLIYSISDSTMKMYGTPTIWSEVNQLTSDSIWLTTGEKSLKTLELFSSAIIVSMEDSIHYNQVRGKYMKGFFKANDLYRIKVEGNGQTVYYAKEDSVIKAVNRADCTDLIIYLKDEKIDRINFITKPEATIYPLDQISISELKLKDFSWRDYYRPHKMEEIFIW